jgi:hypothetical protein
VIPSPQLICQEITVWIFKVMRTRDGDCLWESLPNCGQEFPVGSAVFGANIEVRSGYSTLYLNVLQLCFRFLEDGLQQKGIMLACNRLRLDAPDGSPWEDYRIENGHVEMRVPDVEAKPQNSSWRQLTPEQITLHVTRSTVVAQWLQRRIGVHALLRACTQQSVAAKPTEEESSQEAVAA